jgi:hypothetical protein
MSLDQPNQPQSRAFAQALLFGPDGNSLSQSAGMVPQRAKFVDTTCAQEIIRNAEYRRQKASGSGGRGFRLPLSLSEAFIGAQNFAQ